MLHINSLILALFTLSATTGLLHAQQIHLPPAVSQSQGMGGVPVKNGDDVQKQQAMAANLQRQEEIRRDTDKMFQLTADLKDYLQKNDQAVLSVDAIKKAEQIEKLAHTVKSKLKQSF
jgi:GTP1/Obg family GTP-binding protein